MWYNLINHCDVINSDKFGFSDIALVDPVENIREMMYAFNDWLWSCIYEISLVGRVRFMHGIGW